MADPAEFGNFLKSRRARLSPEQAGIDEVVTRRRVSGLRREEVAALAGISVEYYVRLEQGRVPHPSESILDALARALSLDEVEREHLHNLVRPARPDAHRAVGTAKRPGGVKPERVRPELRQLLDRMDRVAALVYNHRMDVLAWNQLACELFFDFDSAPTRDRNLARFGFLRADSRERFVDWHDIMRATVGTLRLAAGKHADDDSLAALIGELTVQSETFRTLWAGRDVRQRTHGTKRFRHPMAGELTLRFENFDLPGEQRLVVFSPAPSSREASAFDLLAMWTAPPHDVPREKGDHTSPPER